MPRTIFENEQGQTIRTVWNSPLADRTETVVVITDEEAIRDFRATIQSTIMNQREKHLALIFQQLLLNSKLVSDALDILRNAG